MEDFKAMDKHNENALSFADVRDWMVMKSVNDPCWRIFLTSGPVLAIAHKNASKHGDSSSSVSASKMVDVTEFRTLLVHLFAVSIMWSHFQNADQWEESGGDIGNKQLNFEAFKLACRTLASANAKEDLSDEEILSDFHLLDENNSLTIGFIEVMAATTFFPISSSFFLIDSPCHEMNSQVCNFCCKYIDDPEVDKKILVPKFFGEMNTKMVVDDLIIGLDAGPKTYFENTSIEEKNHGLILALTNKIAAQEGALKSATALEHQNNIRKKYTKIQDILQHPACCGFLLHFCETEHNSENLCFIRDVEEYREIFSEERSIWVTEWKEIDAAVAVEEESIQRKIVFPVDSAVWASAVNQTVAQTCAENLFRKYLNTDSISQVCASTCVVERTARRIELLRLYGPAVFDEACEDPLKTMEKDVLPRFRVSETGDRMVSSVASCEPPPPAADLRVPPPGNLLVEVLSIQSLTGARRFALEEVIGCECLYNTFNNYLSLLKESNGSTSSETLKCVRAIDIFEELMTISCLKEAGEQAWQIFRYYAAEKSAFKISISPSDMKRMMIVLACPRKGMFSVLRENAVLAIKADFKTFSESAAYNGLPDLMKELKQEIEMRTNLTSSSSLQSLTWQKSKEK